MSSVPSPRVRKPKPRERLNHLTMTISNAPTCAACARVRAAGSCGGVRALARRHREHAEHLQAPVAPLRFGDDARAFVDRLEAVAPQHRHMDRGRRLAVVGHDEAVALGDVEPFHAAGNLDQVRPDVQSATTALALENVGSVLEYVFAHIRPPNNARVAAISALSTCASTEGSGPPGSASSCDDLSRK